jgi:hypothetical protein
MLMPRLFGLRRSPDKIGLSTTAAILYIDANGTQRIVRVRVAKSAQSGATGVGELVQKISLECLREASRALESDPNRANRCK